MSNQAAWDARDSVTLYIFTWITTEFGLFSWTFLPIFPLIGDAWSLAANSLYLYNNFYSTDTLPYEVSFTGLILTSIDVLFFWFVPSWFILFKPAYYCLFTVAVLLFFEEIKDSQWMRSIG